MDRDSLENLETYLESAPIERWWENPLSGAHPSLRVELQGGVYVIAKPEDRGEKGPEMVRAEASAWQVARGLTWPDLLAATVLRRTNIPDRGDLYASVQIAWPYFMWLPDLHALDPRDILRAAVFDVVIYATDRGNNNYLGVAPEGTQDYRLRLVDHGHAFGLFPERAFSSSPFDVALQQGGHLDDEIRETLRRFVEDDPRSSLADLLPDGLIGTLCERAQELADTGQLAVPSPP